MSSILWIDNTELLYNVVSMTTVTRGGIIDMNVRIENPDYKRIVFRMFLQFFYFWDTHIFNHYTRHYYETLRALADKL